MKRPDEDAPPPGPLLRIGEFSRRLGVEPHVLRNWEQRYGIVRPIRGSGGYRLYSAADEARVRAMLDALAQGAAPAEAARLAAAPAAEPTATGSEGGRLDGLAGTLADALGRFDADSATEALDELLAGFSVETVLGGVVLPYLRELGVGWERGEVGVHEEHFASRLLEARLLGLARGWDRGAGPIATLACPPREQHTLALIAFGLALRNRGWRIVYLGADTPIESVRESARQVAAEAVVLVASDATRFADVLDSVTDLARERSVYVAGAGASPGVAAACRCRYLSDDPIRAAARL